MRDGACAAAFVPNAHFAEDPIAIQANHGR
jgi:hypothetical protein